MYRSQNFFFVQADTETETTMIHKQDKLSAEYLQILFLQHERNFQANLSNFLASFPIQMEKDVTPHLMPIRCRQQIAVPTV